MSTAANKALVSRLWDEVFTQHNLAMLDELISHDFVNHADFSNVPGVDRFRQILTILLTIFPDTHITVEDLFGEEDRIVSRITWRATHLGESPVPGFLNGPPTGKEVIWNQIHILRIADGKVAEHWAIRDDLGLMQQLGMLPSPQA